MRALLVSLMLLPTALPGVASEARLLDMELRSLAGPARASLAQYRDLPVLMVFFEPECPWCFRQVRALNRLLARCPGQFQPLAVGTNGARRALLAEYRRLRPNFPAFQISGELLDKVGSIPATPFMLLVNRDGLPAGWLRGFVPGEKLQPVLAKRLGVNCDGQSS
ncbi:TlpA family protein disulfide reductase [Microbulbifer sp. TYP-18]|uniref:TlpA family protein disulfide reductase n=1 Tax=Microbulbifer sp. TYP-18 TaxID=3230024 RepID=UPI0034C5C3E0